MNSSFKNESGFSGNKYKNVYLVHHHFLLHHFLEKRRKFLISSQRSKINVMVLLELSVASLLLPQYSTLNNISTYVKESNVLSDSGFQPQDSGSPNVDSGHRPVDSGSPPVDSGFHALDSGFLTLDS